MDLRELLTRLWPMLNMVGTVPASALWLFVRLCSHFQSVVSWSSGLAMDRIVEILPHNVTAFLVHALDISEPAIHALWSALAPLLWVPGRFGHQPTPALDREIAGMLLQAPHYQLGMYSPLLCLCGTLG
jgi:hypothetical protein